MWYNERYKPGYDFAAPRPESQQGTGHFTQVVWIGSAKVGAAVSACGKFLVCTYFPAGNVVTRYAHKTPIADTSLGNPLPPPSLTAVGTSPVDTASAPTVSARPSASVPVVLMPIVKPLLVRSNLKRTVTIGTLRPEFGVQIAVDGAPAADAQRGYHLTLDGEKHVLTFTCKADACAPYEKVFAVGDKDETIDVAMKILPATLTIKNAESGSSYRIVEEPTVAISAGVPATIPMDSARRVVHVVEYPSQRTATGRLQAGKEASADMASPN